jgi:hypothetical protein
MNRLLWQKIELPVQGFGRIKSATLGVSAYGHSRAMDDGFAAHREGLVYRLNWVRKIRASNAASLARSSVENIRLEGILRSVSGL